MDNQVLHGRWSNCKMCRVVVAAAVVVLIVVTVVVVRSKAFRHARDTDQKRS